MAISLKKLSYRLIVDIGKVEEAAEFFVSNFGCVKRNTYSSRVETSSDRSQCKLNSVYRTRYIVLVVSHATIIVSENGTRDRGGREDPPICVQLSADIDVALILANRDLEILRVSGDEVARGIILKVLDPYGYTWAFSFSSQSKHAS